MRARDIALFTLLCPLLGACEVYDPPPVPSIAGVVDGLLPTGQPALEITFSEEIDPSTLRLQVVPLTVDAEGALADEDTDSTTTLTPLFVHDPQGDMGGQSEIVDSNTRFRIVPDKPFPVGPTLAVLVEKGLSDRQGHKTSNRTRLSFTYQFKCSGGTGNFLPSGAYFFLFQIQKPIPIQIQIFADVQIDPKTGTLYSQFTNADRNPDPNRCPTPCKETEACRLLPEPKCVTPSDPAGSVDEFSDFVPNATPPTGFSFTVDGCAEDTPEGAGLATIPTALVVQKPPVEATDLALTCSFVKDAQGAFRCTGNAGAKDVKIGGKSAGPAEGTSTGRLIPADQAPKDIPAPPPNSADPT